MEKITTQLHDFRNIADTLINSTQHLLGSREISLAHTNLQRCKMWLGRTLGLLAEPTPYPDSENPANKTIEPQADHSEKSLLPEWEKLEASQTVRVKHFRAECEKLIQPIKKFCNEPHPEVEGGIVAMYVVQSLLALEEAKMWLGWELNRILIIQTTGEPLREMIKLAL